MWRSLCRKIQEPSSRNLHHNFLALKSYCGKSREKILVKNSTVALQFNHWQIAHKSKRGKCSQWILEQSPDIAENIVWTDKKFICLHQKPHRKNDQVWADNNPHYICETNDRNDEKVIIVVAIVHGMAPIVNEFFDLYGNKVSVNGVSYLNLLPKTCLAPTASDS